MNARVRAIGMGAALLAAACAAHGFEHDSFKTSAGNLEITFFGHASLMFEIGGKVIYVDPVGKYADYAKLPKADLVLITHAHYDHLDPRALAEVRTPQTQVVVAPVCTRLVHGAITLHNGESQEVAGVPIEAVPAYNIVHKTDAGIPFHPKGEGNGYVLTFGDTRVYVAGDTENIPEMRALKGIDIAFLPMNLPYTMTPEMVADAARMFRPKILYPYHYGNTDPERLVELLKNDKDIEVRIRSMR
jgi:L-ascorbate metabolism protein UlaG (beta-lactamase superfamily)